MATGEAEHCLQAQTPSNHPYRYLVLLLKSYLMDSPLDYERAFKDLGETVLTEYYEFYEVHIYIESILSKIALSNCQGNQLFDFLA